MVNKQDLEDEYILLDIAYNLGWTYSRKANPMINRYEIGTQAFKEYSKGYHDYLQHLQNVRN